MDYLIQKSLKTNFYLTLYQHDKQNKNKQENKEKNKP